MAATYQVQLPEIVGDSYSATITAGSQSLTAEFTWPTEVQDEYDNWERVFAQLSQGDPINEGSTYNRTYDWIDYYLNLQDVDLDEWLATSPALPESIAQALVFKQKEIIQLRTADAQKLNDIRQLYKENLVWMFSFTDTLGRTSTGVVRPGGWYQYQDNYYSFRFVASLDSIQKDQIQYVQMEITIYDDN